MQGLTSPGLWDDTELDELLKRVAGSDGLTDPDDIEVPAEATVSLATCGCQGIGCCAG